MLLSEQQRERSDVLFPPKVNNALVRPLVRTKLLDPLARFHAPFDSRTAEKMVWELGRSGAGEVDAWDITHDPIRHRSERMSTSASWKAEILRNSSGIQITLYLALTI